MKHIIFCVQQLQLGGVEKATIMLANELANRGYNIDIYSALKTKYIIPLHKNIHVRILTKFDTTREKRCLRFIRKISELIAMKYAIKEVRNSIIISTRNEYSVLLSQFGKNNFKIAILHNDYNFRELRDFKYRYSNINYFVQLNDTICNEIQNKMKDTNNFTKVIAIPNFIEKMDLPIQHRENRVIAVGGLRKVKGFDRLLDIWREIIKDFPEWKLQIVGDGSERVTLERLINAYNISDSVELLGFQENRAVFELMRKAKIYALTSYAESFSLVTVEAMQCGLPVVAFDVRTGPANLIKDNITGFLVNDKDIMTYMDKLRTLMDDEIIRERMSTEAYKNSMKYTSDSVIHKWINVLKDANDS